MYKRSPIFFNLERALPVYQIQGNALHARSKGQLKKVDYDKSR